MVLFQYKNIFHTFRRAFLADGWVGVDEFPTNKLATLLTDTAVISPRCCLATQLSGHAVYAIEWLSSYLARQFELIKENLRVGMLHKIS